MQVGGFQKYILSETRFSSYIRRIKRGEVHFVFLIYRSWGVFGCTTVCICDILHLFCYDILHLWYDILWLRFWRQMCFFMFWGMLNTKITGKKCKKILRGGKMTTKDTFSSQKNIFEYFFEFFVFNRPQTIRNHLCRQWSEKVLGGKIVGKKFKKVSLVRKCIFHCHFATP